MAQISSFYQQAEIYGPKRKRNSKSKKKCRSEAANTFAQDLKRQATEAEIKFCQILDEYGFKYEFQKPFKHFGTFAIVDFYLPDYFVVVEIDGGYHLDPEQAWQDGLRAGRLLDKNKIKKVVRFSNEEVLSSAEKVVRRLCREILPPCARFGA